MSKLGLEQLTYIGKSPSDDSLIVDDVNDRVGIGTSSPSAKLHVSSTGTPVFRIQDADGTDHYAQMSQATGSTIFDTRHGTNNGAFIFRGLGGGTADEYMRILSSGNIGIANTAPASELVVNGDIECNNLESSHVYSAGDIGLDATDKITFTDNTRMDITINNVNQFRFENDGDFHANGDVIAFSTTVSDERLKENIKLVDGALDKVKQLKGVTFNYTQDGKVSAGVIAQDVEKVLPEAVAEKKIPLKTDDGLLYKTVRYDALHSLLIEAIKELSAEVDELKRDR